MAIEPQFVDAYDFYEGLASVWVEDGYGMIDKDAKLVIPAIYEDLGDCSEGRIYAFDGKHYGYLNTIGEWAIAPQYEEAWDFDRGVALVSKGGKQGAIDAEGTWLIEPKYDALNWLDANYAEVQNQDWYTGIVSLSNEIVVPIVYEDVVLSGDFFFCHREGKAEVYDLNGKLLLSDAILDVESDTNEPTFWAYTEQNLVFYSKNKDTLHFPSEAKGFMFQEGYALVNTATHFAFIRPDGTFLYPWQRGECENGFKENRISVRTAKGVAELWGEMGNIATEKPLIWIGQFSEGYAAAMHNGKIGYIDLMGKTKVLFVYDYGYPFREDRTIVQKGENFGVIDRAGRELTEFNYGYISWFEKGYAEFELADNGLMGVLDDAGNEVIAARWEQVSALRKDLWEVSSVLGRGVINRADQEVVPPVFTEIDVRSNCIVVQDGKKQGVYDFYGKEVLPPNYSLIDEEYKGIVPFWRYDRSEEPGYLSKGNTILWPKQSAPL